MRRSFPQYWSVWFVNLNLFQIHTGVLEFEGSIFLIGVLGVQAEEFHVFIIYIIAKTYVEIFAMCTCSATYEEDTTTEELAKRVTYDPALTEQATGYVVDVFVFDDHFEKASHIKVSIAVQVCAGTYM